MKRYIFAILVIILAGCSQDMTEDVKVEVQEKVVRATTTDDSRTYFEQDNDVYNHKWAQDDEIGVFDKTTAISEYLLIDGVDTKNGTFLQISMSDDGKTLNNSYAIYPYSESYKMTAEGVFNITFPAEQTYDSQHPNSYGKGANILVGMGANDNFAFKNVCGFLEIQLKGSATISEIRLRGNNNERIAGAGIVSYKGDAEPKTTMLSAATNEIVLNIGSGVALDAQNAKSFIIALPPTTFTKGFTVTTSAAEFSTERNIVISRNKITPMAVIEVEEVIPEVPETWKIYYTATGKIELSCDKEDFGANIIASKFDAATGSGVVVFDAPVTCFGSPFAYNDTLTSIVIPDSVTEFDWFAFDNCYNLTSVNIPNGVTTLPEGLFEYCDKLASITIPDSVTTVEDCVFMSCIGLTDITFGKKVTSVGANVFYGCEALSRVEFLSTTPPTLSESAFYINPDSTKNPKIYVPDEAFVAYCSCNWREEYKSWIVGYEQFANRKIEYTAVGSTIIEPKIEDFGATLISNTYENGRGVMLFDNVVTKVGAEAFAGCKIISIALPNSVTSIEEKAFSDCTSLTNIIIPNGVLSIGNYAFWSCTSLTNVTIPENVTTMGICVFRECNSLSAFYGKFASNDNRCLIVDGNLNSFAPAELTEYTIEDNTTAIGDYAFYQCEKLQSVVMPNSVVSIGNGCFRYCRLLRKLELSNNVKTIGKEAFCYCDALYGSLILPEGLTSIGKMAFHHCVSLTKVTIPSTLSTIEDSIFWNCPALKEVILSPGLTCIGNSMFKYCPDLTKISIPDSVTSIGDSAFSYCASLISIYIPEHVTYIGSYAFFECSSLFTVTIPNGVKEIKRATFSCCTDLYSVDIGSGIVAIETQAFGECESLKSVKCRAVVPPALYYTNKNSTWRDIYSSFPRNSGLSIYVPRDSYDDYMAYTTWTQSLSVTNWYAYESHIKPYDF